MADSRQTSRSISRGIKQNQKRRRRRSRSRHGARPVSKLRVIPRRQFSENESSSSAKLPVNDVIGKSISNLKSGLRGLYSAAKSEGYTSSRTRELHRRNRSNLKQAKESALQLLDLVNKFDELSKNASNQVKSTARALSRRRERGKISRSEFKEKLRALSKIASAIESKTAQETIDRALKRQA